MRKVKQGLKKRQKKRKRVKQEAVQAKKKRKVKREAPASVKGEKPGSIASFFKVDVSYIDLFCVILLFLETNLCCNKNDCICHTNAYFYIFFRMSKML